MSQPSSSTEVARKPMSMQIRMDRRLDLEQIRDYHRSQGRDYMSFTKIFEQLIQKEHDRLFG